MTHLSDAVRDELESHPNVVGTCLGRRRVGGRETDEPVVVVLVSKKLPRAQLADDEVVPETVTVDGETFRTDVQEVGDVRLQAATRPADSVRSDRTRRWRPAPAGVSLGHPETTAGTLGSPPLATESGETVVLTNAHVAAPIGIAEAADPIYQPGPADGGDPDDELGRLHDWSEITRDGPNRSDSALVAVDPENLRSDVLDIGPFRGWTEPDFDDEFTKSGRTTDVTTGSLRGRDARIEVGGFYDDPITFEGVDVFGPMSAGGDSGSLIGVERADGFYATSLLFAGSDRITLAIPIEAVRDVHGPLSPLELVDDSARSFRAAVERRLVDRYGAAVEPVDSGVFRVTTWPVSLAITVVDPGESLLDAVGPALAAANGDSVPVLVYPEGDASSAVDRVRNRATVVAVPW
ncbi:hypothetical protein ACNS7O_06245 [Haloferacaceae archaeon DSL9]